MFLNVSTVFPLVITDSFQPVTMAARPSWIINFEISPSQLVYGLILQIFSEEGMTKTGFVTTVLEYRITGMVMVF